MRSPPRSAVRSHRYFRQPRDSLGSRRPATTAATMMCLETRNGTPEPPSSATQRWCGLLLGVVARTLPRRAARAGGVLKRPRLYDDVRDLCSPPWHASRRRAGSQLGVCSHFGASAAVASSSLASHKTHETGSIWLQRSASDLCAALRHRSDCETTSSAAAETKSCCIQFCMALRRSIRCDRRC